MRHDKTWIDEFIEGPLGCVLLLLAAVLWILVFLSVAHWFGVWYGILAALLYTWALL